MSDIDVEAKLKGTTLVVYWHLLKSGGPSTARRLQRELKLSSPSVAAYHLEKLCDLGLVEKNPRGDYEARQHVPIGALRPFVRISSLMVPRFLFYTAYFASLLVIFLLQYLAPLTPQSLFALLFGASATIVTGYEAIREWRLKPI
ncbi:MAG: hypothetical protein QW587_07845 [Candidatus Bathyarchaeia archaeon]